MDSHMIAERANLIRHRLYAAELALNPHLLSQAASMISEIENSGNGTFGTRIWNHLFRNEKSTIIGHMLDQGEVGQILRSNSPFSILIGQQDTQRRRESWKLAIRELSAETI